MSDLRAWDGMHLKKHGFISLITPSCLTFHGYSLLTYNHDGGVVRNGFGHSGFQVRHSKGGPIVENLSQTLQPIAS